jgi:phosphoserine phosphatase
MTIAPPNSAFFVTTFICPSKQALAYWGVAEGVAIVPTGITPPLLSHWQQTLEQTFHWQLKTTNWLDEQTQTAIALTFEGTPPAGEAQREWETTFRATWAVDVAIEPFSTYGKKRLLISDMDSTLLAGECIDELAQLAGVGTQVAEITHQAMNGLLDFEGALRERVGLLKGKPADWLIQTVLAQTPFMLGAEALCATQKANGTKQVVVSGGFLPFTQNLCERLQLDGHQANSLGIDNEGVLTGTVENPIFGKQAKIEALHQYAQQWNIPLSQTIALGDGANDLGMILTAGMGVAFHAKQIVAQQAPFSICFGDLTTLLYYQGYKKTELRFPLNN